ncbi:hypothetical protein ATANTOWER_028242 [Ataeniobius toweri]|uniref:Uncharacterized protein n=1 Tax=Ataeniobius toweri TaxID=208326 RepID=A0ABU7CC04_9TELE|nr:hypothetical protein [Ataeniobius toweri]
MTLSNKQLNIYFIYNVLVTQSLFVLETFVNAHPTPLSIYVKWFSPPPAPSESHRQLFTDSEWRRSQGAKKGKRKSSDKRKIQRVDSISPNSFTGKVGLLVVHLRVYSHLPLLVRFKRTRVRFPPWSGPFVQV